MADRLLLCAKQHNFDACLTLAQEYQTGIEVQTFAYPPLFADGWRTLLRAYRAKLHDIPGEMAMHGPFMDLAGGSFDPLINEVVRQRVRQSLEIADSLGAQTIVLHANFIATIRNPEYREGWTQRQVDFWGPLAAEAWARGHVLALENMWEFEAAIIGDVVRLVDTPGLRVCLDVGHAHLFSEESLVEWLQQLDGYIAHIHINNNNGELDYHQGLDDGVLDYRAIMPHLQALISQPMISLEIERIDDMRRSLDYLKRLEQPDRN